MAIVINGSGTVTGLAVGGLPDGTVDAGTLATNSVDSAELIDGAVDASHMSVNSIDSDQYVDASIDNAHLADDAVGVAELSATGTASSSTFLRGDNAWAEAGGGLVVQMNSMSTGSTSLNSSSGTVTLDSLAFASAHTTGNGVWIGYPLQVYMPTANGEDCWIYFKVFDGSTELDSQGRVYFSGGTIGYNNAYVTCLFPAITSTATLTVKITAATNGSTTKSINTQDNARQFFIQEIS